MDVDVDVLARREAEPSASLAFGSCKVEIGRNVDWETLVAASTARKRSVDLPLKVRSIDEAGRLAPNPLPLVKINGVLVDDPEAVANQLELADRFRAELRRRLGLTPRKHAQLPTVAQSLVRG